MLRFLPAVLNPWKKRVKVDWLPIRLMASNAGNMTFLLLWYYTCVALEKIDPLEGGYLRRKYRKDRRPTLPVESPFIFYPRYVADLVKKHITLAGLVWRYGKLRRQMKADPDARNYTDLALTPVAEDDSEQMFVTSAHHPAGARDSGTRAPLVTLAKPVEATATQPRA